ncbi:hypothetical protein DICPUDRAFT_92348 [Dictyostelium purpureum]|uniref:PDK1-type PH domain-containing protein n=1 Tax=Dictyostelium purpureum TaxID=5786 RepID=F0ZQF1_DICPU|nr:uncharacterized protein DICPUDRAFT_92348 [Dictyostelium purpureum]EGC33817.1 hypothetical protein DICPUDRAFT_92348 [Dictyostelium purpureum]|eukprot:XP_003289643.1 hypothetical protein DICPUDRAFT_92348 [Dictyostelium purpureum]
MNITTLIVPDVVPTTATTATPPDTIDPIHNNNTNNNKYMLTSSSTGNLLTKPQQRERASTTTPSPTFLSNHHNQHQLLQKQTFSLFDKHLSSSNLNKSTNSDNNESTILLKPTELILMNKEKKKEIRNEQQLNESLQQWNSFLLPNDEIILACSLTLKRSGLVKKERQLIITDTPRIFYVDPIKMIQKGEIGVDNSSAQFKSSKHFIINSKGRSRHFYVLNSQAKQYVDLINELNMLSFK